MGCPDYQNTTTACCGVVGWVFLFSVLWVRVFCLACCGLGFFVQRVVD